MFAILRYTIIGFVVLGTPDALAYNALKNGDFSGSTNDWNLSSTGGGTAGYESFLGSPAGGSLRLQAYPVQAAHADQCVDVHKWFSLDFALRKFDNAESGGGTHEFKLDIYDAASCGGTILSTITLPEAGTTLGDSWVEVSVDGTPLPSGAVSAKVNLDTISGASGVSYYLIDHVQVVPTDEIFPDGFEGG